MSALRTAWAQARGDRQARCRAVVERAGVPQVSTVEHDHRTSGLTGCGGEHAGWHRAHDAYQYIEVLSHSLAQHTVQSGPEETLPARPRGRRLRVGMQQRRPRRPSHAAGRAVPHTCHTPGASTVSDGNSRVQDPSHQRTRQPCSRPGRDTDLPSWDYGAASLYQASPRAGPTVALERAGPPGYIGETPRNWAGQRCRSKPQSWSNEASTGTLTQ